MECRNLQSGRQSTIAHQASWDLDQSHTDQEGTCPVVTGLVGSCNFQVDLAHTYNTSNSQIHWLLVTSPMGNSLQPNVVVDLAIGKTEQLFICTCSG